VAERQVALLHGINLGRAKRVAAAISDNPLGSIDRALGDAVTARNCNTMTKLHALTLEE